MNVFRLNLAFQIGTIAITIHLRFIEFYPEKLNAGFSTLHQPMDSFPRILILDKLNSIFWGIRNCSFTIIRKIPIPLYVDFIANIYFLTKS